MNRVLTLAVVLAALAHPLEAQKKQSAKKAGAQQALLKLEDDWAVALVKRDRDTFERMLAPGFIYSEDDKTMTRQQVLNDIVSGSDSVTAAHNEGMEVHLFGQTGLVTGWLIVAGRNKGGAFNRRYRFTDTWANRKGNWQIVGAHDYLKR